MSQNQELAIEQLEVRQETVCINVPYGAICYKRVWFINIPYLCTKWYRLCF